MKSIYLSLAAAVLLTATSCDDVFTPSQENIIPIDQVSEDARFAQGVLNHVYRSIPGYYDNSEYATDDAVTNETDNNLRKMATGSWTANNDPMSQWNNCLNAIQNINLFLANTEMIKWAEDPEAAELFKARSLGEAHGLRALFTYYLLRAHAGIDTEGNLAGVPLLTEALGTGSDFNIGRASFDKTVESALADLDFAESHLPMSYNSLPTDAEVPAPFNQYTSNAGTYNRVMGMYARQLIDGLACRAIRSRLTLLAASPAFEQSSTTWAEAADAAAAVLDNIGGPKGLDPKGLTYYCNTSEIDNLSEGVNPAEIIWREGVGSNTSDLEKAHFPPSLYGNGRMNPTQNLVDAFPMANGYPISDSRGGYDAANPYAGRDPRLSHYIIYNGSKAGVNDKEIFTAADGGNEDALNARSTSTRTGYYMKKRLRMDVNTNPSMTSGKIHIAPRIRYTEIFLNYAEAANRAWGPRDGGPHAYSAYDVIKAIRARALGITEDPYLDECAADTEKMEQLIRNERRLELCFESFRFWDLRRWKADITEDARGISITAGNVYTILPSVEKRAYEPHMYYGPIPAAEVLKFSNLKQNRGW